jgi:Right handed beta helix region
MTTRAMHAVLPTLVAALLAPGARADLDRPPSILEYRQLADEIHLLWAPGGDADGTLNGDVASYTVQQQASASPGLGLPPWQTIFSGDQHAMTYVESITSAKYSKSWNVNQWGIFVEYRVESNTTGSDTTLSAPVSLTASLPVWIEEAQDGKARLGWVKNTTPHPTWPVHLGYKVQKLVSGSWVDLTDYLSDSPSSETVSYLDLATTPGVGRYRVRDVWKKVLSNSKWTFTSNEVEIEIGVLCDGQGTNPAIPPLSVIVIDDRDEDLDYDGDDIADALEECADKQYEDLSGPGDDDGVCEPGTPSGETCITGGCILRALPKTYDDVAIKITNWGGNCDDLTLGLPPEEWNDVSHPEHCLVLDFPAGLVIEGQGHETVFRSPVWVPPYLPAAILEVHRREFPVTLRNLVLDGRKHEQVDPEHSNVAGWHHFGFRVWNQLEKEEISGDGIGNDNGACESEACAEDPAGDHDADGRCEAGEDCLDEGGGSCDNDIWTNAIGCFSPTSADDGCIHNVEVRNVLLTGAYLENAQRWIIEDSEFHDMGCVNRGYGFDCPSFDAAPDESLLPGYKTTGYGMNIGSFTSQFQVRRNEFYRTGKYGLSFNSGAGVCTGRLEDHEASYNDLHHLGGVGIFNHGTAGARIHHNTIDGTALWNEPPSLNGAENTFGVSLGGECSDGNEFSDNVITNMAGLAIHWNGTPEMVECTPSGCTPVTELGNVIRDTDIDGTCLEKDATPGAPGSYGLGSIHTANSAAGTLSLIDNTLINSGCSFTISAYGQHHFVQPLSLEVAGGSYESGPNAPMLSEGSALYCGAMHAHGSNRKIVVGDDTSIVNATTDTIPKACIGYDATFVIDDEAEDEGEGDPFADGDYTDVNIDGTGTVIECSDPDPEIEDHPDCQQ